MHYTQVSEFMCHAVFKIPPVNCGQPIILTTFATLSELLLQT